MANLTKILTGVAVGAADEALERQDDKKGRTGFKRWSNMARLVAVVGGYAVGQFLPRYATMGEDVAHAATPLLTKTVARQVVKTSEYASNVSFQRRVAEKSDWVPAPGGSPGGGYRPLA